MVASMPMDLYGAAGASDGTYSYHAGGTSLSSGTALNTLYRYNPIANSWTSLAPMPDANMMASAVYYPPTNKIYVFGGEDEVIGFLYDKTRIYDIASDTWTTGAFMPGVRAFMGSGYNSANGKIYLVSGYNGIDISSAQPNTWEYDPVADTFTERAPIPHPVGGVASGLINGHLYVAGGRDADGNVVNLVWDYDIAANTWSQRRNMPIGYPSQHNVPGSAVALDNLWVFGGGIPFGIARQDASITTAFSSWQVQGPAVPDAGSETLRYDPGVDRWFNEPDMNVQRSLVSGAGIGNKLIATGGFNLTSIASTEVMDACVPETTPIPCETQAIVNGGFESGSFSPGWVMDGTNNAPVIASGLAHSGTFSALVGNTTGSEPFGDSSFYQEFNVPANGGTLSFWHSDFSNDSVFFDWQDAYITDVLYNPLLMIFHQASNDQIWTNETVDMTPFAGQTVRIKFLVHQDAFGNDTGMYVDDVVLLVPCASPTPSPTATPIVTPTPSPSATATATPRFNPTPRPRPAPRPRPTPPR